jgi:hypothetical protein
MSHSHQPPSDKSAAFTGLLVTAAALFAMVVAIVMWTNTQYAGEKHEGSAAEAATKH